MPFWLQLHCVTSRGLKNFLDRIKWCTVHRPDLIKFSSLFLWNLDELSFWYILWRDIPLCSDISKTWFAFRSSFNLLYYGTAVLTIYFLDLVCFIYQLYFNVDIFHRTSNEAIPNKHLISPEKSVPLPQPPSFLAPYLQSMPFIWPAINLNHPSLPILGEASLLLCLDQRTLSF